MYQDGKTFSRLTFQPPTFHLIHHGKPVAPTIRASHTPFSPRAAHPKEGNGEADSSARGAEVQRLRSSPTFFPCSLCKRCYYRTGCLAGDLGLALVVLVNHRRGKSWIGSS